MLCRTLATTTKMPTHLADLSHAIQLAVAPVFLLTAISTLINAMNGRLGRIVDRRRVVQQHLQEQPSHPHRNDFDKELDLLARRGRLIYLAIFTEALSALLVCVVVTAAFVGTLLHVELALAVAVTFILALLSLIVGLGIFLREVYMAVQGQIHWEP